MPIEINLGLVISRQDMKVTHEEADTILIHQVLLIDILNALVVAEDADVFVLFCHFIHAGYITGQVKMILPDKERVSININKTVEENRGIMPYIPAAHGLTGCDNVAKYLGIGKIIALKSAALQRLFSQLCV